MKKIQTVHKPAVILLACFALAASGIGCADKEPAPAAAQQAEVASAQPKVASAPPVKAEKPPVKPAPEAGAFEALKKKLDVPLARVPVVSAAPKVDGAMDAVYKSKATPLEFKFLIGGDATPTAKTTVYVVSTAKKLFIFFNCESPDMDALLADTREHDGAVWSDDSVEIFIDPTNKRQFDGYMHLAVNPLGTTYEAKGPKGDEDTSWDPKMDVAAKVSQDAWTVELAIPFAELVKDPAKINRLWAVNFNRMAQLIEGPEDTAWSPTGGTDSHVPNKFGTLWMDVGTVDNIIK